MKYGKYNLVADEELERLKERDLALNELLILTDTILPLLGTKTLDLHIMEFKRSYKAFIGKL